MTKKYLLTISLALALLSPAYGTAQSYFRDDHHDRDDRYYDRHHKDYHQWNEHEQRAYRIYWEQHHHKYVDWNHASEKQRERYWD